MHRSFLIAIILLVGVVSHANAITILSTDFDGRTVAGSTASNLTWVTNGVSDPGALTADTNPDGLFDTAHAQDRFAVDRNLHNEGTWSVDIDLAVGASAINLNTVQLDAFIFNNAGDLQGVGRQLSMTVDLRDAGLNFITGTTIEDIYIHDEPGLAQPKTFAFGVPAALSANTNYVIRVTAFGQGPGNNSGIDNLIVDGDIVVNPVPEPATAGLAILGIAGVALRRKRC
jgi:hypothetical protein